MFRVQVQGSGKDAAILLQEAAHGMDPRSISNPQAAYLLHRLGLIRVELLGLGKAKIRLTRKSEELGRS